MTSNTDASGNTSVVFKANGQPAVQTTITGYDLKAGDTLSSCYAIGVSGCKVLYGASSSH